MRAFVVLACIAASASASLDPFETIPQLEPFKGFLPTWLNSSLYKANAEDLVILKELIANGTTVSSVDELLKVLKANGDGNIAKVLSSAYAAVDKELLLVELPTRAHAVEVLRNGRLLKDSACQHIFVGLSMTPQERTDWFRKRQQLKATAAPLPPPLTEAPLNYEAEEEEATEAQHADA
ncbi:hypothetical protein AAVH_25105 [Aphelenchoides avenae]|nr:hypothetical protein AAVH_25105 [Aphelenchus avenae]